jgi:hypothetical protein
MNTIYSYFLLLVVATAHSQSRLWRNLTATEITSWYSPVDLCVLRSEDRKMFPFDIRTNLCGASRRLYCAVGMGSNNFPCYGPFSSSRPSFFKGIEGFTDSSKKPLIESFKHLISTNTTLVFLGDSTMRQKFQALECELHREEPHIRTNGQMWGVLPCDTKLNIQFPDGSRTEMIAISMGPNSRECLKGGKGKYAPASGAYENAEDIVRRINFEQNKSVAVLANIGLWYNDESEFMEVLPLVLQWLKRVTQVPGRHNIVAWHETTSQHWNNSIGSGYYNKQIADETEERYWKNFSAIPLQNMQVPACCLGITNTSYMADWRNDLVADQLKILDTDNRITVFPFAKYTRLEDFPPFLYSLYFFFLIML